MSPAARVRVLTANDLRHGHVVYLGRDGGWTRELGQARATHDEAGDRGLLALAEQAHGDVVGPYLMELAVDPGGRVTPVAMRERHRLSGPSVPTGPVAPHPPTGPTGRPHVPV